MIALGLVFGSLVGFSLGLTGGGGAIFAVPLLVYGLQLPTREAVGVSLITVGATAIVGFIQRLRRRTVEIPTGLLFAVAGMATAPLGAWLSRQLPEAVLLVLFGALMLLIAARMWIKASRQEPSAACVPLDEDAGPTCRRDPQGELHLTSRCALLMAAAGLMVGVLTGLFGVGGGFIIVPALVTFSGMAIERAVGTSLLVISLVSVSGIVGHFVGGDSVPAALVVWFLAGSLGGMIAGTGVGKRLAGRRLQQVFAMLIVAVGVFVIARNLIWD
ncbi:MAG TPA: sulfite exporter TauE/SafE family protein [Pirellulales bacterium]|nr:sulfite exporter TauE/SafE family protein [Pirellulales bacterium]